MQKFYNGEMRDMTLLTKKNLDSFRGDSFFKQIITKISYKKTSML